MSREIKFRAYIKPEYWNYENNEGLMTNGLPLGGFDKWWLNLDEPFDESKALDGVFTLDEIIIMQFTGIKDKAGNDIYEGDILKTKHGICYVIWDDIGWALKSPGSEAIDHVHSDVYTDSEVIGNIHENPELL